MEKWKEFVQGKIEVIPITGDHNSLIRNPAAQELARRLAAIL